MLEVDIVSSTQRGDHLRLGELGQCSVVVLKARSFRQGLSSSVQHETLGIFEDVVEFTGKWKDLVVFGE